MRITIPIVALSLVLVATSDRSRSIFPRQSEPIPSIHDKGPGPIAGSAQAFRENDALYIWGGETQSTGGEAYKNKDLFYKLDLSIVWNTSDPAWTRLNTSGYGQEPQSAYIDNIALSKDGSILFAGAGESILPFQTQTNRWWPTISLWGKTGGDTSMMKINLFKLGDVTDLDSGIVYGMVIFTSGDVWIAMFDPSNGNMWNKMATQTVGVSSTGLNHGVFISPRKSIFYMQSWIEYVRSTEPANMFQEYKIADNSFVELNTTGDVPTRRLDPCIVSAYGGTKMIVLGGANATVEDPTTPTNRALNGVYMLDVVTLVWTRLADAPSPYYKPICAVSGDYLVAYGGYSAYGYSYSAIVTNGNPPSILNLKENIWVTEYKPSMTSGALEARVISIYSTVIFLVLGIVASI